MLGAALLGATPSHAAQGPVAHDVLTQIADLDRQPTPMAFWRGDMPLPGPLIEDSKSHFQGITRHPDPRARVLYVSASQGAAGTPTLAAVEISSADLLGSSRLRSNRLVADRDIVTSPPFSGDRVVWWKQVDAGHPGGLQAAGDYLAVPYTAGFIEIYDITNPVAPKLVDLDPATPGQDNLPVPSPWMVGGVGFIQLSDGTYVLVATTEWDTLHWFQTNGSDITTLSHGVSISTPDVWPKPVDEYCSGVVVGGECQGELNPVQTDPFSAWIWPAWFGDAGTFLTSLLSVFESVVGEVTSDSKLYGSFNNFSLLQDDNRLYLAAMWNDSNTAPVVRGKDSLVLYDVFLGFDENDEINQAHLGPVSQRSFDAWADDLIGPGLGTLENEAYCGNFHAGSTVWVSPDGELFLYTIEHYAVGVFNWNVMDVPLLQQDFVAFGEYHDPRDPLVPVTAETAHVVLYSEQDFGGMRVEWSFADFLFEQWAEFSSLPGPCAGFDCNFANAVQSLSWRLPSGMVVNLYEDENYSGDAIVLSGSGSMPVMTGFEDFIEDVASLELVSPAFFDGSIMHAYTDSADKRQVLEFPSTSLLNLGAWRPLAIKLEPGVYAAGNGDEEPVILDFPTKIRALSGDALLGY